MRTRRPDINSRKVFKFAGAAFYVETYTKYAVKSFSVAVKLHLKPFARGGARKGDAADNLKSLGTDIRSWMNAWIKEQEEYDGHICIVNLGKENNTYVGTATNISLDIAIRQKRTTTFSDTLIVFESKLDLIYSSLKTLLEMNGFGLN